MTKQISDKRLAKKVRKIPKSRKPIPYDFKRDGITQSLLATWSDCREAARLMVNFWERAGASKESLIFGSFWHYLLEINYGEIIDSGEYFGFDDAVGYWFEEEGRLISDPEMVKRITSIGYALYEQYWHYYVDDFSRDWVAVESKFDIIISGYRLRGMCDGLFKDKRGRYWLLETKTASGINENTLSDHLGFNFQNLFYITALEHELGIKIAGVLYNVIVKPNTIKVGTKANPTFDDWAASMEANVANDPDKFFHRFEIAYTRKRIEAFRKELFQKLWEFRRWHLGEAVHYRNEQACIKRWNCQYLSACGSDSTAGYTQTAELFSELGGRNAG